MAASLSSFCPACDAPFDESAEFCRYCGMQRSSAGKPTLRLRGATAAPQEHKPAPARLLRMRLILVALLALASGVLVIVLLPPFYAINRLLWPHQGRITFITTASPKGQSQYLMREEGFLMDVVSSLPSQAKSARFSPDGQMILYLTFNRQGRTELYIRQRDGTQATRLAELESFFVDASWSPDSKQIVLASRWKGQSGLYIVDIDDAHLRQLTQGDEENPTWSPDGQQIAFTCADADEEMSERGICVVGVDGTGWRRVTSGGWKPSWSPDGQRLAFVGDFSIYRVNIDGSNLVQLTSTPENHFDPAWSPDGEWIAFTAYDHSHSGPFPNGEIYIVRPDGSQLTRLTNTDTYSEASVTWTR